MSLLQKGFRKAAEAGLIVPTNSEVYDFVHMAGEGDIAVVQEYVEKYGEAIVNRTANTTRSALHEAAWNGHDKIVELLLEHGAEVDKEDNGGLTPLMLAKNTACVEALLMGGANLEYKTFAGETVFTWAALCDHSEILAHLLDMGWQQDLGDALLVATRGGNINSMRVLLDHGVDADVRSAKGETPLMAAALRGCVEAIELLLSRGARCDEKDFKNVSVMDCVETDDDWDATGYTFVPDYRRSMELLRAAYQTITQEKIFEGIPTTLAAGSRLKLNKPKPSI